MLRSVCRNRTTMPVLSWDGRGRSASGAAGCRCDRRGVGRGGADGVRSDSHAPSDRFPCPQAVQFGYLCGAVRRAGDPSGNSALRLSYQPGQCAGRHELAVGGDARRGRVTGAATDRSCGRAGRLRGVGELPQSMSVRDFMRRIQERLPVQVIRHSELVKEQVRRVAVCTGAGARCSAKRVVRRPMCMSLRTSNTTIL